MNTKCLCFPISIICVLIAFLSGCSESTKQAAPLPEVISKVHFPYIKNGALFSFDPVLGTYEKLAESDLDLFLALDIDETETTKDESDNDVFSSSASAEFFVFANTQTLHIYDINTKREHLLYSFEDNVTFDSSGSTPIPVAESFICDIQKVITLDEDARLSRTLVYKDELKVYVKTSINSNCAETDQSFNYWQIDISESTEEFFSIRRRVLLDHTHKHTHFHDHDDPNYELAEEHNHDHKLEKGEEDPDNNNVPFDQNNHEHSHTHSHDFIFPENHFHDYLLKESIDETHSLPSNQEIIFETHPVLIGRKSSIIDIDEALMYSGKPVVDLNNRTFGYLGLNSQENAYKFFSVDLETLDKRLLWTLKSDEFLGLKNTPTALSDIERLVGETNRPSNFDYLDTNILLIANQSLFYFTLEELFDDDEAEARDNRMANPIFKGNSSPIDIKQRIQYDQISNKMTITEGKQLWSVSFSADEFESPILIKDFTNLNSSNDSPDSLEAYYLGDNILVRKLFNSETSLVSLQENGLENQTIINKTSNLIDTHFVNFRENINSQNIIAARLEINTTDLETNTLTSTYIDRNLDQPLGVIQNNISIPDSIDYRSFDDVVFNLRSSNSPITPNSLNTPSLFLDQNISDSFGEIPIEVSKAVKAIIVNDTYGLVEVSDINNAQEIYFFSIGKTSFNLNDEFLTMKALP